MGCVMTTKHYINRIIRLFKIAQNIARSARIGDIPSLRSLINEAEAIVSEIEIALRRNRGEVDPGANTATGKPADVIRDGVWTYDDE